MSLKKILIGGFAILVLMWIGGELLIISDTHAVREVGAATTTLPKYVIATSSVRELAPVVLNNAAIPIGQDSVLPEEGTTAAPPKASTTTPAELKDVEMIDVTLTIDGKTYAHRLEKGGTVAELLLAAQNAKEITFTGKAYAGLGMLITSILGKENNMDKNDMYWIYSVNGRKAAMGVSQYVLSQGDIVSWSYEPNTY